MDTNQLLKAEKENIFALTHGYIYDGRLDHQIIMLKKKLPNKIPFYILYQQKTTNFKLSKFGKKYSSENPRDSETYESVAKIDEVIPLRKSEESKKAIFKDLCNSSLFPIWEPTAPLDFIGRGKFNEVYIIILRVYLMNSKHKLDEADLRIINHRPNFYELRRSYPYSTEKPALSDSDFNKKKSEIIALIEGRK